MGQPLAAEEAFDALGFRRALGSFATGIAVTTACGPTGELVGMTLNSFNSVSLDPPLILFSIDRKAKSLPVLAEAEGYAINILSTEQEDVSRQFARSLSDKWRNVGYRLGIAGAPLLDGSLAHFECAPYAQYDGGDHVIFVGQVLRFGVHPHDAEGLVFYRGRFRRLAELDQREAEWRLPNYYW
ncbi:Flavin reductase [Hyphomicrobiales bacterium]|nr:Flavin reductase [Hyphomicrobiales bacterium]CAH1671433.1 Flavin reductase [Hyphomicrobiales bacterium]